MQHTYVIPNLNGGLTITPIDIKIRGFAGAPIEDDVSIGGFFVDLSLITPRVNYSTTIRHATSQPVDTKSVESIKEWALEQLLDQYGVAS